jgi:chromosome segregation ATPase
MSAAYIIAATSFELWACCCVLLQLLACQARVEQLEGLLADSEARLQQAQEQLAVLAAERDAAARNLLRAEAELNDVSDYSTKMFRQVGSAVCRHVARCMA